jgi:hypothetical protein
MSAWLTCACEIFVAVLAFDGSASSWPLRMYVEPWKIDDRSISGLLISDGLRKNHRPPPLPNSGDW